MPRNTDNDLIQFLVVIAFALITGLYNWFKRRRQGPVEEGWPVEIPPNSAPAPPPTEPRTPPRPARDRPADWEEELRRLLQGEEAESRPSPPVIVAEPPSPVPPPLPVPAPVVASGRRAAPASFEDEGRGLPVTLPSLQESAQAYLKASQIDTHVAERLQRADELLRAHRPSLQTRPIAREIHEARAMLHDRASLRSAFIASVILGQPRGFER